MWFKEPEGVLAEDRNKGNTMSKLALGISIAGTLVFGIYPELFFNFFKLIIK